ncbi:hypothetical protein [Hyphomicrobium sp.]|uniref:hypothetical protein n=1 Tax=Hyphomicrobium sp. TaxID=82 RepID=UPI000FA076C1|nr:hypothetical protein [Hyphomicrobium sp.]RUP09783.1 MAG: hypothetical protein EKK38_04835 [Hyphomicrobium sp.]
MNTDTNVATGRLINFHLKIEEALYNLSDAKSLCGNGIECRSFFDELPNHFSYFFSVAIEASPNSSTSRYMPWMDNSEMFHMHENTLWALGAESEPKHSSGYINISIGEDIEVSVPADHVQQFEMCLNDIFQAIFRHLKVLNKHYWGPLYGIKLVLLHKSDAIN